MADDVKSRLIEIAGTAFGERGYDAVGVREICATAGANVASINYHFGDKRGLYRACLRHAQTCRVEELAQQTWPADFSATDKLRAYVGGMLEVKLDASRPQWHLELMLREMSRPTDACREIVEDYIRPMAESLAAILRELAPGSAWNAQTWMVGFSVIGQILFYQVHQPAIRLLMGDGAFESLTLEALTEHITHFSLAAIGQAPPFDVSGFRASTP